MGIKANFSGGHIDHEVREQVDSIHEKILESFIRAGEEFVKDARSQGQSHSAGQYEDVTANLRNSIGYYVIHDGEIVMSSEPGDHSGRKTEGKMSPEEIAGINSNEIRERINQKGYQLIGVAGMNYASYVESKGYNVISYQADTCIVNLSTYLERLNMLPKGTAASFEESFIPG